MCADSRNQPPLVPEPSRGRRHPAERLGIVRSSILAGPDVNLVEVSSRELIVEADVRLAPGAGICLNVTIGDQTFLAGGRVSKVDAALVGGQVKYRAGVVLDTEIPAFDVPDPAETPPARPPAATPAPKAERPGQSPVAPPAREAAAAPGLSPEQQQAVQLLKTALRASEAARKELEAEHAKWEEQRRALEERAARAEKAIDERSRQLHTSEQAERILVTKHTKEQAAWTKERAALVETVKQAEARLEQLAKEAAAARDAERASAETYSADKAAWQKERSEFTASKASWQKEQTEFAASRTAWQKEQSEFAASKAAWQKEQSQFAADRAAWQKEHAEHETARAAWEKERSERDKEKAAFTQQQAAWTKERQTLQDGLKAAEARAAQLNTDVSAARESEKRFARKAEEQSARYEERIRSLETSLQTRQRELEAARASLAAAEQKLVSHEQERQSWGTQKERLTSRLQLTEKWCADQQELLYLLRQQVGKAFALVDEWKPSSSGDDADEPAADDKRSRSRKATA